MKNIIKSYNTTGLCGTCYRDLPATIEFRSDGTAVIIKTCPEHGREEFIVEKDWKFWESAKQPTTNNLTWEIYNEVSIIEITDRCNVLCKHCYHGPDNKIADKPLDFILSNALRQPTKEVCLMGAEPTMREDLFDLIREIKSRSKADKFEKKVSMYTNGIKLTEKDFVTSLEAAGLGGINISIHNPDYHKPAIWEKISSGIDNILHSKINLGQISFTVENLEQVEYAVDRIMWFKQHNKVPYNFCIRSPADIGTIVAPPDEIFASDIANWIDTVCKQKGLTFFKHDNCGSNPYHIGYLLENMTIQIIHWAGARNIDTSYMNMGPWAEFVPNTRGTFLIQTILRDGLKKGWWQGNRIMPPMSTINFIK